MNMRTTLALLLAFAAAGAAGAQDQSAKATLSVAVDTLRRQVVITAGPFDLANEEPMADMDMMDMSETPMMRFQWPVDGWLRGVDITLQDSRGDTLPIRILHHLPMFNFDRRSLVHTMVERLFSWGQDTQAFDLPSKVAAPLPLGDHLGFVIAWHNDTGKEIHDAYMRMTLSYVSPKKVKVPVIPWYVDVANVYGGVNSFDLPPGRSTQRFDFQVPMDGRLIMVGGHMHDYGLSVRLVDSTTGRTLVKLKSVANKKGDVTGTGRFIFGFNDDALRIYGHHTYTLITEYDNLSGKTLKDGGMGLLAGAFQPDSVSLLPKIDYSNPNTIKDIRSFPPDLGTQGTHAAEAHDHAAKDTASAKP